VVVTGGRNRLAAFAARYLPRPVMLRVLRQMQERRMARR